MSCTECERVSKYMAADPEMYRDERRECTRCREARLERMTRLEEIQRRRSWRGRIAAWWPDEYQREAIIVYGYLALMLGCLVWMLVEVVW